MEILLGVFASGLAELVKLLSAKLGAENSKKAVLTIVFTLVLIFTYLTSEGFLSQETINHFITLLTTSIATYQLIIKPIKAALSID